MHEPLAEWLRPGPVAAPERVAAALARALLPPEAADQPPQWLRADQRLSFARALAAVRRYGGALLADGVGTGKTFIGLAVAAAVEPGKPIHVLAPAALLPQWRKAASAAGVEILPHSHETLSRGRAPLPRAGPLLIDESHRFRTPVTRRYQTLAPWCVGRRGLLLSATPVVNRLGDLSRQLLLVVRDDALAWAGVASLGELEGTPASALAELVVTGEDRSAALPEPVSLELRVAESADSCFEAMRAGIAALRLSRDAAISGLLRGVLHAALASSPLALATALAHYRSLLQHAQDALTAGRPVSRQTIRRFVGAAGDQLVLWPLVAETVQSAELAVEDLEPADALERGARAWGAQADAKILALRQTLADGKPTLLFTTAIATVEYLRRQLGRGVAWCTGEAAGLDGSNLPREVVLDWFRQTALRSDGSMSRPAVLVATDVAAEGLDLPLVQRVIHYDLPWTAVRLEQRGGRALRLGSAHRRVEVVRFLPPSSLEAALRRESILERKSELPDQLGLGHANDAPWRLRAQLAARWREVAPAEGVATMPGGARAEVTGFRIGLGDGSARALVCARTTEGWTDSPAVIAELLEAALGLTRSEIPGPGVVRGSLRALARRARAALRRANGEYLLPRAGPSGTRRALRRVLLLLRDAARSRDGTRLRSLQRGVRLLRRGHTAGETALIERWASLPVEELLAAFQALPDEPVRPEVTRVELVGLLLVERRTTGR